MHSKVILKGRFLPENIIVVVNPILQRKTTPEIEAIMTKTWDELELQAKSKNQMLWNGESLRLDDFKVENDKLILSTSLTDYRTRICLERNIEKVESLGMAYLSAGLAIGGFVESADGQFIFIERSLKSITQGQYDFVGGVMDKIQTRDGLDLLNHNFQEIQEEINIAQSDVLDIQILGLVLGLGGNVIIITYSKLKLNSTEVLTQFSLGHDDEVSHLKIVTKAQLPDFMHSLGGYKPKALELLD